MVKDEEETIFIRQSWFEYSRAGNVTELLRLLLLRGKGEGYDGPSLVDLRDIGSGAEYTSLHFACERGYLEQVILLLNHNADIYSLDKLRKTPVHHATQHGHGDILQCIIEMRKVDFKKIHGCGSNLPLIHTAVKHASGGIAGLLLVHGCDPNEADKDGETPLHIASTRGKIDIVRLLLDFGASVDAKTLEFEYTPLHYACRIGAYEVSNLLVERGASIYAQACVLGNKTPIDLARDFGHVQLISNLINIAKKTRSEEKTKREAQKNHIKDQIETLQAELQQKKKDRRQLMKRQEHERCMKEQEDYYQALKHEKSERAEKERLEARAKMAKIFADKKTPTNKK